MSIPFSISRSMMRSKGMDVKFHVKLIIDDTYNKSYKLYHNTFNYRNKDYLILDINSYVSIKYVSPNKEDIWDPNDSIMITDRYIYYLLRGLGEMKDIMLNKDTYYLMNGKLKITENDKNIIRLTMGKTNSIQMSPSIMERDGIEYETVTLCINTPDRLIELDLETFEALIFNLSKVDYFLYSQAMVTYFISSFDKEEILKSSMPKYDMMRFDNISTMTQRDSIKDIDLGDKGIVTKKKKSIFEEVGLGI